MPPIRSEETPPLGLKLDSATAPEGAMWDQKGLLDCFAETRGLEALKYTKRVAMLAECRGKDGLAQLGAIALPLNDPAVVTERASTYLNRGRQQVRAKRTYEALTTFLKGADYVDWLVDNPYGMSLSVLANLEIRYAARKKLVGLHRRMCVMLHATRRHEFGKKHTALPTQGTVLAHG